jgi:hypothetical protein
MKKKQHRLLFAFSLRSLFGRIEHIVECDDAFEKILCSFHNALKQNRPLFHSLTQAACSRVLFVHDSG